MTGRLVAFVIGLIVGITVVTWPWDFKKDFTIADILNLLFTLIVAGILQYHFGKKQGADRTERDLLIHNANDVLHYAKGANAAVAQDFDTTKAAFKSLSMSLYTLEKTVEHAKLMSLLPRVKDAVKTLKAFREAATMEHHPLSAPTIARCENLYQTLHRQLSTLILDINRG